MAETTPDRRPCRRTAGGAERTSSAVAGSTFAWKTPNKARMAARQGMPIVDTEPDRWRPDGRSPVMLRSQDASAEAHFRTFGQRTLAGHASRHGIHPATFWPPRASLIQPLGR